MKRSTRLCVLLVLLASPVAVAHAQSLLVMEVSDEDAPAGDKLLDLIEQPVQRLRLPEAREPAAVLAIARKLGAERVVILDGGAHRVHLVLARDGTVLTRVVEQEQAWRAPYVMAFVAVELIALSAQLERGEPAAARQDPLDFRGGARVDVRLGAELLWMGAPFRGNLRPALGVGAWFARSRESPLLWLVELECAFLGEASVATRDGRIALSRTDAGLRGGVGYALGRVALVGFVRARAALTSTEYLGPGGASSRRLTFGAGGGIEADFALTRWAALYASTVLDLASSRSDYRVQGTSVVRDPPLLGNVALGVAFFEHFQ
jgi:hypothetical protein